MDGKKQLTFGKLQTQKVGAFLLFQRTAALISTLTLELVFIHLSIIFNKLDILGKRNLNIIKFPIVLS